MQISILFYQSPGLAFGKKNQFYMLIRIKMLHNFCIYHYSELKKFYLSLSPFIIKTL